jgi:hypothetical protein
MIDGIGVYGSILHYALLIAIVGSTLFIFIYLWCKGRLDMDESAKDQMMKGDDYE